ncbi:MAG: Rne/Rng family ribonuclease [Acidobacteriota bacterium]|nr:Rne/Rng family ribonuclease [Acidobacteriota bacterium]
MSKEMIISVNGREKRIAILENGQVTEFYIERGEENSGVVGNIYKGRVQRVLPGMQSAFVEIGLERDAFLYVSDFFDEEEEFERIMLEKTKKSPPEIAAREAGEQIKKARLEREHQMEEIQEIVEPLIAVPVETGDEPSEAAIGFEAVEDLPVDEEKPAQRAGEFEESRGSRRGKRDKGRRGKQRETGASASAADRTPETEEAFESTEAEPFPFFETADEREEDASPLFEIEDSGFERVVDDEEETPGEIFKDAFMQEAIIDKVRAVEFDMESTSTAEVGSLLDSVSDMPNGFQRIADEDEAVSESTAAAAAAAATAAAPQEEERRGKSKRGRGGRKSRKEEQSETGSEPPAAAETAAAETEAAADEPAAAAEEEPSKTRGGKSKKDSRKSKEQKTEGKEKSSGRGRKSAKNKTAGEAPLADADASVTEPAPDIAEMAVRRGGRRRGGSGGSGGGNRGGNRQQPQQARSGPTEDRYESSKMDETISSAENEFADAEMIENSSDGGSGSTGSGSPSRSNGGGYQQGGRRESRRERERNQPTITDLLREGQEILVQIAKEPIARKGARITSHIALPGRYLVYMPTIEHVGVSRKIESGGERNRLRTLIQKIRNEEDVPSGGFIVRTAGIGVPEENLREDARYLVRTWKDVKKTAEKSKSPALVHQDLDIIQRILRDQLSDDFTAIRVDSEEEYLRIVEFVNRIQPRMVNRVKLYTRDEPILEAFNVQEEIDKALKPRVWLRSGGYLVINQTEALVAIDVNTGKFVGKGNARLEDTITKTNMEAVEEISRQIRLRDLGGIIVLDLIDMEDRRNRQKVLQALQEHLSHDKSPTKVLSFNDFGLIIMTRKRVKQSLERTLCAPCAHCQGAGWVKSPQTVCYNILEEARRLSRHASDVRLVTLRVHPEVLRALRGDERVVLEEIEAYLGAVDITSDPTIHEEQFDFAFI